MKRLAVLLGALALVAGPGVAWATKTSLWSDEAPPARFRGQAMATVGFFRPGAVSRICSTGMPPVPRDLEIIACSWGTWRRGGHVVLPDPCPLADRESYARIVCHELAHLHGWPATHGP